MDQQCTQTKNQHGEDAALRSRRASREPIWPLHGAVQKPADAKQATVGRAIEKRLRPIPCRVKYDGDPDATGAQYHKAKKQPCRDHLQNAQCGFSMIAEVSSSENK